MKEVNSRVLYRIKYSQKHTMRKLPPIILNIRPSLCPALGFPTRTLSFRKHKAARKKNIKEANPIKLISINLRIGIVIKRISKVAIAIANPIQKIPSSLIALLGTPFLRFFSGYLNLINPSRKFTKLNTNTMKTEANSVMKSVSFPSIGSLNRYPRLDYPHWPFLKLS